MELRLFPYCPRDKSPAPFAASCLHLSSTSRYETTVIQVSTRAEGAYQTSLRFICVVRLTRKADFDRLYVGRAPSRSKIMA
jgi:hypothetical protein